MMRIWFSVSSSVVKIAFSQPVTARRINIAASIGEFRNKFLPTFCSVGQSHDMTAANVAEWSHITNLNQHNAVRISPHRHPSLKQNVWASLSCEFLFEL